MSDLLEPDEDHPALVLNEGGVSPIVLVCEHASNRLPRKLGTLGLAAEDLQRHIAYDIGAEAVSRVMAAELDAALVLQRYSRLAYDCNRSPEHPGAMPEVSEIFDIPGNRNLSPDAKLARINCLYRPFHAALAGLLDRRAVRGGRTVFVTMHSFTPVYLGKARAVELGLLFDQDARLAEALRDLFPDFVTRLNEPYSARDGVMHTANLHAATRGLASLMIEVRNDLITTEQGQRDWAMRLSNALRQVATKGEV